jgi:hypothetical protein
MLEDMPAFLIVLNGFLNGFDLARDPAGPQNQFVFRVGCVHIFSFRKPAQNTLPPLGMSTI